MRWFWHFLYHVFLELLILNSFLGLFVEFDWSRTFLKARFLMQSPLQHLILNTSVIPIISVLLLFIVAPLNPCFVQDGSLLYFILHHLSMLWLLHIYQLLKSHFLWHQHVITGFSDRFRKPWVRIITRWRSKRLITSRVFQRLGTD